MVVIKEWLGAEHIVTYCTAHTWVPIKGVVWGDSYEAEG